MKYANDQEVQIRDKVIGRDPAGRPIAGIVEGIDRTNGTLVIAPMLCGMATAQAEQCVPLSVFDRKSEAEAKAPAAPAESEPSGDPNKSVATEPAQTIPTALVPATAEATAAPAPPESAPAATAQPETANGNAS